MHNNLKNTTRKQGLVNFGGAVQKCLFRTLGAEDDKRYHTVINILKQNQQKIITEVNSQSVKGNNLNQQKIEKHIESYLLSIENITD